jgi:hypothetical protein
MMKMLEKSLKQMHAAVEKTLSERASIYFSKEIVKFCTTEFASAIADSLLSAWNGSLDSKGNVDPKKFESYCKTSYCLRYPKPLPSAPKPGLRRSRKTSSRTAHLTSKVCSVLEIALGFMAIAK